MRNHIANLRCVFVVTGVLSVTSLPDRPLRPVTVCEVISDLDAYGGKTVAVVGRLGGTDEGTWLDEENCPRPLQTNGFTWPSALWITTGPTAPTRAEGERLIDKDVLKKKVLEVSSRTKLRARPDHDSYAVLYGRLETRQKLETFTYPDGSVHGFGFGHLGSAPAQLVFRGNVIESLFEKEIQTIVKKRK